MGAWGRGACAWGGVYGEGEYVHRGGKCGEGEHLGNKIDYKVQLQAIIS